MSSTDAAIGTPCSCSITSSRPSSPCSRPRRANASRRGSARARPLRPARPPAAAARAIAAAPCAALRRRTTRGRGRPGRNSPSTTRPLGQQARERGLDHRDAEAKARADVLARERTMRAAEAPHQIADRIGDRLEQRHRQSRRQRHADRIAIARRILDRDEALARRRCARRSARRVLTSSSIAGSATPASLRSSISVARQIAEPQQQVVNRIGRSRMETRRQVLQLLLERVEHGFVEQIAQLGVADQIAQLRLIDRQRLRAPFGQRRIAVVDVVGDVAEQQRRRERRRLLRFDVDDAQRSAAHAAHDVGQRRQVEDVAQALAIGLENDRKRSESRRHREQIRRALAQLPERRARAGPAAGQQQRAAGGFAEPRREHRRRSELPHHQPLDFVGIRQQQRRCPAAARHPDTAPRTHRRTTSPRRRGRLRRGCARWPPSPTARGCGCRAASAPRRASRRDRRASARSRSCDRRGPRRRRRVVRRDSASRFAAASASRP